MWREPPAARPADRGNVLSTSQDGEPRFTLVKAEEARRTLGAGSRGAVRYGFSVLPTVAGLD